MGCAKAFGVIAAKLAGLVGMYDHSVYGFGAPFRHQQCIQRQFSAERGFHGAHWVFGNLREACEAWSKHRVERIMQGHKIKAVRG